MLTRRFINALVIIVILLLVAQQISSAPAYPGLVDYQLPDGTTLTIRLLGDEKVKWAETPDGYTILLNKEGFYEYAIIDNNGDLVLSGVKANNEGERSSQEDAFVSGLEKNLQFSESQIEGILQRWNVMASDENISTPNTHDQNQLENKGVAAPAYPGLVDYQLPDGTTLTIRLLGDEKVKWAETPDGYTILLNKEGFYEYAIIDNNGDLVLSGVRANNEGERSSQEDAFLSGLEKNLQFSESQIEGMLQRWNVMASDENISTPKTHNGKQVWFVRMIMQIYYILIKLFGI